MREEHKFPAFIAGYLVVVLLVFVIPDNFIAFMVGGVGGGMFAINAGEQLRKDRARRQPA